ncbi:DUF6913 domain-containing protein [Mesonia aquimarina]|uniref:DUF6913 domain-containing protein n=1 Tax=Mesonia aquimarina TaxID=1504967 RepID=UPI000EF58B0E|nr:hypothetical protein [Mesonia aquimarina]
MQNPLKKYYSRKIVQQSLANHRPSSVKELKKVGVILSQTEFDFLDHSAFAKTLNIKKEQLFFMIFSASKEVTKNPQISFFSKKELTLNGTFKKESEVRLFQQKKYDLLINYFSEINLELLLLSASIQANLKIGFPIEENRLNDLDIKENPKNWQQFLNELKKYLSVINP